MIECKGRAAKNSEVSLKETNKGGTPPGDSKTSQLAQIKSAENSAASANTIFKKPKVGDSFDILRGGSCDTGEQ